MTLQLNLWTKPSFATSTVLVVWIFAFMTLGVIQLATLGEVKPDLLPSTLDLYGGVTHEVLFNPHEWYRAFCAPLYHVSWSHLAQNCLAFYLCGLFLEPFIKAGWFLFVLYTSSLAGVFVSCLFLTDQSVSVGGSGGIMGLIAAGIVISFRIQERYVRNEIRSKLLAPLTVTLLPALLRSIRWALGYELQHDGIDHWAHMGGALMGTCTGCLIIAVWPPFEAQPRFDRYALLLSLLLSLLTVIAVFESVWG